MAESPSVQRFTVFSPDRLFLRRMAMAGPRRVPFELPGARLPARSSSPETLGAVGRGIAERRRARHHFGQKPPGRRAERQSPMGVAVGEPQPALSRRASDHRPGIRKTRPPPFTPSRNPSASRRKTPGFRVLLRFVTVCTVCRQSISDSWLWQFKRMSGSSGLKVQAAIAC